MALKPGTKIRYKLKEGERFLTEGVNLTAYPECIGKTLVVKNYNSDEDYYICVLGYIEYNLYPEEFEPIFKSKSKISWL